MAAWTVADRVRGVPPTTPTLVGSRFLRYDVSVRKAGRETDLSRDPGEASHGVSRPLHRGPQPAGPFYVPAITPIAIALGLALPLQRYFIVRGALFLTPFAVDSGMRSRLCFPSHVY